MIAYRCYLLGYDNKIKDVEIIECATDAAALAEAEHKLSGREYPEIEVWDRARRVGKIACSNNGNGVSEKVSSHHFSQMAVFEMAPNADGGNPLAVRLRHMARQPDHPEPSPGMSPVRPPEPEGRAK